MEDVFIYGENKHTINTLNGVLNEDNLALAKRTLLFDAFRQHIDIVSARQHYPKNDLSEVELKIDVVLMSRKKYERLMKLDKELNKNYNPSKKEFLDFPKLKQ